jgi:pantetheine-phosphate adenylyltransferase
VSVSVICPGSFDPVTLGHLDVFERAAATYDHVVIAVVGNPSKSGMFDVAERIALIEAELADTDNVEVIAYQGLLVELCRERDIMTLCKGLRSTGDFEYELQMAQMNRHLAGVETVLLATAPAHAHISSSLVKEIAHAGGSVTGLVPPAVERALAAKVA